MKSGNQITGSVSGSVLGNVTGNVTGNVIAIGDVHGCAKELRMLLAKLPITTATTVVFLGDYVDRGPDSKGVIDEVIALRSRCRVVSLEGNHEAMMLEFLDRPDSIGAALFILNGGTATLESYPDGVGGYAVPEAHRRFLRELLLVWESERHFFVHAGVPDMPLAELVPTDHKELLLWVRTPFLKSKFRWGKLIVHGHSPVDAPEFKDNRINLDTGCVFGNRLTALDVSSMKVYSVDRMPEVAHGRIIDAGENRAPPAKRFNGVAPVFIVRASATVEFETLNYNETGLLIQEREGRGAQLAIGERVVGWVGLENDGRFHFKGVVVRTESRNGLVLYGVRLDRVDGARP